MKKIRTSLSLMRLAATFAVIYLHVCSTLVENPTLFPLSGVEQRWFLIGESVMRWSVPLFLMITGCLLLNPEKAITPREAVMKYALRMVLALLVFGYPFSLLVEYAQSRVLSLSLFGSAFLRVLNNEGFAHLWYLYLMTGIYLLLPFLKAAVDRAGEKVLRYAAGVVFILGFLLPFCGNVLGIRTAIPAPLSWPLFYLLAGYLVDNDLLKIKPRVAAVGILLSMGVIVFSCVWLPGKAVAVSDYTSPITAVLALCLFGLLRRTEPSEGLWKYDRLCFGVYLVHPLFIQVSYRVLNITPTGVVFPAKALTIFVVVSFLAFTTSWLLGKIPCLRRYVL